MLLTSAPQQAFLDTASEGLGDAQGESRRGLELSEQGSHSVEEKHEGG